MLDRGTRTTIKNNDINFLFKDVREIFSSCDFTIANFECVACDTLLKPVNKQFVFRANPEWLSAIHDNGITHVTLANNHSFDFGEEGIKQTIANLKHYGIHPIGYNADDNPICSPTIIEKNGNNIAVFSCCFLKQLNNSTCNENAYSLSENIKAFKKAHPDYFVFVCLHWGIELKSKPTAEQVEQAHLIINSGADAIIGHHPHVVQTIENFKGKYIFYSIGNFIFDNNHPPASRGIFPVFSLSEKRITPVEIIPFNIVTSKPELMTKEESEDYMKEIGSVSTNIKLKQSDGSWKIL